MPNNKKISNIQEHHTLAEYQRYFSHLLRNGKLKRYPLKEKNKLDPNRQYWKIKDEKGETFYYEVPKYIKPESTKSAYSLSRVMHRRPARAALAIFAITAIFSITSAVVAKKVFVTHYPDVPPADLNELQTKLHNYQEWAKEHPGEDVSKSDFTISDLANTAMATVLYDPASYTPVTGYNRRSVLAIGNGHTTTMALYVIQVDVDISNAFIFKNNDALEESISFSNSSLPEVPKVGLRDFYYSDTNRVQSNKGVATDKTTITWNSELSGDRTKDEYISLVGKIPDSPFLYTITNETVLKKSTITKTSDGYQIYIDLDKTLGVANYIKRIKYLSNKVASDFTKVDLTLTTDNNLELKHFHVEEHYEVDHLHSNDGKLTTDFHYGDIVPDIPSPTTSFEYSKYPTPKL